VLHAPEHPPCSSDSGSRTAAAPSRVPSRVGEKQRVAIARAPIWNDPAVILADEPTGNLDSGHGQEVLMILHEVARDEGRAVLVVTNDPPVEDIADRILWLEDGALAGPEGRAPLLGAGPSVRDARGRVDRAGEHTARRPPVL